MNQGYTIVEGSWDTSAPVDSFAVTFPTATNKDGSAITGPGTEEFVIDVGSTPSTQPLTYPAATADKSKASMTVREHYADIPIQLKPSDWDYADPKLTTVKLTSGNFGTGPLGKAGQGQDEVRSDEFLPAESEHRSWVASRSPARGA
jgi:hypothetical protein